MAKKMDATLAFERLFSAVEAIEYLENAAQRNVNADGAVIAAAVGAKEDVDPRSIMGSGKIKINTTKYGRATVKMLEFAKHQSEWEQKQLAIETPAVKVHGPSDLVKA